MAFDPQRLLDWDFGTQRHSYDARDAIVYALGVGLPFAPGESDDLSFLLEDRLTVLPAYAVTLATPGMWPKEPALEIVWEKVLHMAHAVTFHQPLPAQAEVVSRARVTEIFDRGADKGAVCYLERDVSDAQNGTLYSTILQTVALRGEGGFGGDPLPRTARPMMPERAPDHREQIATSERAALIYRLSGDLNPLHADYDAARRGGFDRPILHGLASYGTACAVILRAFCDNDPTRLKTLNLRFAGVVMPGDVLEFHCWNEGGRVLFEGRVGARVVIDQGVADLA
ncbi:MAG: MaoC/PaaZ C-terminal domain-containing protein [Maritimibacter sp.]